MSLVDKFEHHPDAAFARNFDRDSARRQFRVSLFLVAAMASAAFFLGFALPSAPSQVSAPLAQDDSGFAGRLVGVNDR